MYSRPEELKTALERSNGRAAWLVHPLDHLERRYEETYLVPHPRSTDEGRAYLRRRQRLISCIIANNRIPLLISSSEEQEAQIRQELGIKPGDNVFFIHTEHAGASTPKRGWVEVTDTLREMGLQRVVVFGEKLFNQKRTDQISRLDWPIHPKSVKLLEDKLPNAAKMERLPLSGCVSDTLRILLRAGFKATIAPRVSYPALKIEWKKK